MKLDGQNQLSKHTTVQQKKGKGATVVDGKMIDEVHYKRAKALLEI